MKRSEFIKKSCGACAALSIGLLLGSNFFESCASSKMSVVKIKSEGEKIKLSLDSFNQSPIQLVRVEGYEYDIAIKKIDDNHFLALLMMCTHARHPLVKSGNSFYCTLHGSRFNGDGTVAVGPASQPLHHLQTQIINTDIQIELKDLTL